MNRMDGWGVTGWANVWTTLGSDAADDGDSGGSLHGYGVQRTVDPGVVYVAPPEVPDVPRWHAARQGRGRVFDMSWQEDSEPSTRSLLDVHKSLVARRRTLSAGDSDLAMLDFGIAGLVSAAATLHASGASLGFLQPDSCRVGNRRDHQPFVVLPDVGFAWDKRSGLMPPKWISSPPLALLFERGAEQRNESYLAELVRSGESRDIRTRAVDEAASDLADVKILARLVAVTLVGVDEVRRWCGGTKCLVKLPAKDVAPDTQAEIWDKVIAPALEGQIKTCDELRAKLAIYKPSSHYLHVPPTPPWSGWPMVRRVAAVAVAAGVLAMLYTNQRSIIEFIERIWPSAPYCRLVPTDHPLFEKLSRLKAADRAAQADVTQQREFWALLEECHGEHGAFTACGRDCLRDPVNRWLQQAEDEGRAVRQRLRDRPRPTADEVAELTTAVEDIRRAEAAAKRPGESAVVPSLERELDLRGGPAAEAPSS